MVYAVPGLSQAVPAAGQGRWLTVRLDGSSPRVPIEPAVADSASGIAADGVVDCFGEIAEERLYEITICARLETVLNIILTPEP